MGNKIVDISNVNNNLTDYSQLLKNRLFDHYFGLYCLYLDFGIIRVVRTEHPNLTGAVGESLTYIAFCKMLQTVSKEQDINYINKISDINYLKRIFEKKDFGSYVFDSFFYDTNSKISITWNVLDKNENNIPSVLVLGFSYQDDDAFSEAGDERTPGAEADRHSLMVIEDSKVNSMIENIVMKYDLAYSINISNDTFNIMRLNEQILMGRERIFSHFSDVKEFFLTEIIHPSDRKFMENELDYATIVRKLEELKAYSIEYRSLINGTSNWNEMSVTFITKDIIFIGFSLLDIEITKNHLAEMRFNEYTSLFVVDFDRETIKSIKQASLFQAMPLNRSLPYGIAMRKFADNLNVSTEGKEFFSRMSDINNLSGQFEKDDKFSFTYKSSNGEEERWIDMTGYVILKHEDNTPSMVVLGCSFSDTLAIERQEMQNRLKEDMHMISGLASGYETLFYINIEENIFEVFRLYGEDHPNIESTNGKFLGLFDNLEKLGMLKGIHPDDTHIFSKLTTDYLRKKLLHSKKYHTRFRRIVENEYQWAELDVYKYEEVNEDANALIVGITSCDEDMQSLQIINSCFKLLSKNIPIDEAIDLLLSNACDFYGAERAYVCELSQSNDSVKNVYEWCSERVTPLMSQLQSTSSMSIIEWLKKLCGRGTLYLDVADASDISSTLHKILDDNKIYNIMLTPILNDEEIVGMACIANPTKAIKNYDIIKTVASVSYCEFLQQLEKDEEYITLGKLTDAFVSVYYVDLSLDYMKTWKMASEYKNYYEVIENYTYFANTYVNKCIIPQERERCLRMTSPEYIKEQFKSTDRFTVEMTDTLLGHERNLVFDYIRVGEDGSQFVLCSRDMTDTLKKERMQKTQLEKARIAAEEANNSKTNFLFNMSHDIRTPMNAIIGFTNMAQKYIDDKERVLDYLQKIDTSGLQLLSLINQVLEMARIEAGKVEIEENPVNILDEYNSMVTVLTEQARTNGLEFNHRALNIKHPNILADKARLNSICLNITGNAIKYTPKGGCIDYTIEEIEARKEGYASFVLMVKDNGIGMSQDYLKILFEPFTREKSSTVSNIQGTGLGMSIVKNLVEHMGGGILVSSELGKGTEFTINLDFKIDNNNKVISNNEKNIENISFEGIKVLLVEDNELNREIATTILSEKGIALEEAENGAVAVDIIKEKGPDYFDIILMDIQMPVMDGYEATIHIKELYPDLRTPIIALSANAFSEDKEKSLSVGMRDHISKPFEIKEMFGTLAKYVK